MAYMKLLMPLSTLNRISNDNTLYRTASFMIDPQYNRTLDSLQERIGRIIQRRAVGDTELVANYNDQELRQVVEPLESTIQLMETLYPITLALSIVIGLAIPLVFILLLTKEVAILRVLGTTKFMSRMYLSFQTVLPSAVGLTAVLVTIVLYLNQTQATNGLCYGRR